MELHPEVNVKPSKHNQTARAASTSYSTDPFNEFIFKEKPNSCRGGNASKLQTETIKKTKTKTIKNRLLILSHQPEHADSRREQSALSYYRTLFFCIVNFCCFFFFALDKQKLQTWKNEKECGCLACGDVTLCRERNQTSEHSCNCSLMQFYAILLKLNCILLQLIDFQLVFLPVGHLTTYNHCATRSKSSKELNHHISGSLFGFSHGMLLLGWILLYLAGHNTVTMFNYKTTHRNVA